MIIALLSPVFATALLSSTSTSLIADLHVDVANANCATGTGAAGSPVCSIGAAIALAAPGDTIRIAPGTYFGEYSIPFDLTLIGTGGAAVTRLDGTGGAFFTSIVTIPAAVTVEIDGLTLQNGHAQEGGGILLGGTLVFSNSTITDCSGDPLYPYEGGGGGISSSAPGASLTVANSTFLDNRARNGGAILVNQGSCAITNSTFIQNRASHFGGAVRFIDSVPSTHTLSAAGSTFRANIASGILSGKGGGISTLNGTLTVSDSTFVSNFVYDSGGAVQVDDSQFTIRNSTMSGNGASPSDPLSGSGGGILISGTSVGTISNSTISRNLANDGQGGGLLIRNTATCSVQNTIIAQNYVHYGNPDKADVGGPLTSLGNNLIGVGGTSFTNGVLGDHTGDAATPLNPLLAPLQDNGGPTQTHALLPSSLALDAGNPVMFEPVDQRGVARPQGMRSDIGAYELIDLGFQRYFCSGDGGNQMGCTDCPCMNNAAPGTIGGCLNPNGTSTRIYATGNPSVSLPAGTGTTTDLRFHVVEAPRNKLCVLLSGSAVAPQSMANICFGLDSGVQSIDRDGLRCAVMNLKRHGGRRTDAQGIINDSSGTSRAWGGESNPHAGISAQGGFVSGQTRYFQVTHRVNSGFGCMRGLNTSQAVEVVFTP